MKELRERGVYIGDGAYALWDGFGHWVVTSNGIEITNRVYLEPNVWACLKAFVESADGKPR